MTMPGKGTRGIVVDGVAYRWRHRSRRTAGGPLTFAVERESAPGRLISVTLGDRGPTAPCCPSCEIVDAEPITPAQVAEAVRAALADGWDPDGPAGVHRLDMRPSADAGTRPAGGRR
ncbi:hypothetical protein PWG71_07315 [Nocardiopsis sp. N85]|uniref:hypothetical protein n=1 Tax=Nocardiopsis sp. N85 TaxID=3029400 RepID=UPI00237FA64B|nr:hypothetical protein [Nocardiopsis sp. N85]MDE3721194.1 hypothetical protein [Nocardiopsis sp. N85]